MDDNDVILPLDIHEDCLIKVIGVGGGGGNSVDYMYKLGVENITYLVCNTDRQALAKMSVPAKLQLGPGLGAGGKPEVASGYAEDCRERIRAALDDGTQMVFITAGMGGGTGTGASPIVAAVAQEMGILTVGIVTIPFAFEGEPKIRKAMQGVATLKKYVDALLVINNETLRDICPDLTVFNAFDKANDVVTKAARSIADIITITGVINTDFADVKNTLQKSGIAVMGVGVAKGENRVDAAIQDALNSPLMNVNKIYSGNVYGAKRLLIQFYCSTDAPLLIKETNQINDFVKKVGSHLEVQWGIAIDDSLGEDMRVTIIAAGYKDDVLPTLDEDETGGKTIDQVMADCYPGMFGIEQQEQNTSSDNAEQLQDPDPQDGQSADEDTPAGDSTAQPQPAGDEKSTVINLDNVLSTPQPPEVSTPKPSIDDDDEDIIIINNGSINPLPSTPLVRNPAPWRRRR